MRLIDADALQVLFNEVSTDLLSKLELSKDAEHIVRACLMVTQMIQNAPTIDAEPIRHGKWLITDAYPHRVYCSECYKTFAQTNWAVWEDESLPRNYCPNCGAKMDREGSEDK